MAAPSHKHEVLLTSDSSGQLWNCCVWDPNTGSTLTMYKGGVSSPNSLCLVGEDYILSAQPDKPLLNVWQVNRSEQLPLRLFAPGRCGALAVSPSGSYLLAAVEENITVWQLNTGRVCRVLSSHYQKVTSLAFTQDGAHFLSAGQDGQVLCWSLAVVVSRRNLPGQQVSQVGKPDPRWVWRDHALAVTDLHVGAGASSARIVSVSRDQTCKVYSMAGGQLLLSVSLPAPLLSVTMDPIGQNIFTGGENGDIYSFNLCSPPRNVSISSEGLGTHIFKGHTGGVSQVSLSLDSSHLASGSEDRTVRIWHVKSGQCVRVLEHKGAVTALRYLLPPAAMLEPTAWSPARRLTGLQKGADEAQPLACRLFSRTDKAGRPLAERQEEEEVMMMVEGREEGQQQQEVAKNGDETGGLTVDELKLINQQLYQFAVQNILKK